MIHLFDEHIEEMINSRTVPFPQTSGCVDFSFSSVVEFFSSPLARELRTCRILRNWNDVAMTITITKEEEEEQDKYDCMSYACQVKRS